MLKNSIVVCVEQDKGGLLTVDAVYKVANVSLCKTHVSLLVQNTIGDLVETPLFPAKYFEVINDSPVQ